VVLQQLILLLPINRRWSLIIVAAVALLFVLVASDQLKDLSARLLVAAIAAFLFFGPSKSNGKQKNVSSFLES